MPVRSVSLQFNISVLLLILFIFNSNLIFAQDSTNDTTDDSVSSVMELLSQFEKNEANRAKLTVRSENGKGLASGSNNNKNKSEDVWIALTNSLEETYNRNGLLKVRIREQDNEIKKLESDIKVLMVKLHYYTIVIIIFGLLSGVFVLLLFLISFGKQFPDLVDIIKAAIKRIIKLY